jgi:hypothetical protein
MPYDLDPVVMALTGAAFLIGVVAGVLVGRRRGASGRVAELERELAQQREQSETYRDAVAKHFGGTADRFRELTLQYADLHAHLAEGARELAADRAPELAARFPATPIGLAAGPATDEETTRPTAPVDTLDDESPRQP